jgi:hypothetical protein
MNWENEQNLIKSTDVYTGKKEKLHTEYIFMKEETFREA